MRPLPVIDRETWDIVQMEIAHRGAKADHNHRVASQPALLSGLARCSNCGAPMWKSGNQSAYYGCSGRLSHDYLDAERGLMCNMSGVQAVAAEAHVLASLVVIASDQEMLQLAAAELTSLTGGEAQPQQARDSRKIEEQIRRLGRLYQLGLKTDAEFEGELRVLETQLSKAKSKGSDNQSDLQKAVAYLSDVPRLIAKATNEERRALLLELFDVVYLTPHQVMAVRPTTPYVGILKALDQSSAFNQMFVQWAGWGSNPRHSA